MFVEVSILLAFAITIVSEITIIIAIQRPVKIWQWVTAILLVNSLTHPLVIYLLYVQDMPYIPVELGVFVFEMIWYGVAFKLNWRRSLVLSGTANLFSIFVGFGIRFLFNLQ